MSIYLGNGKGGFLPPATYAVPRNPTGLTIADVNGDGQPDLLVGDPYGDVLVLLGNGNGTFAPYRNADQAVVLAVADLTGNGSKDVIYADQGLDRVVVDYGAGNSTVLADQSTGLAVPGAVALADLNGDGIPDLIVANSGSNNVLVYPGLGNGQFGPAVNDGRRLLHRHRPGRPSPWPTSTASPTWSSPTPARTTSRSCSAGHRLELDHDPRPADQDRCRAGRRGGRRPARRRLRRPGRGQQPGEQRPESSPASGTGSSTTEPAVYPVGQAPGAVPGELRRAGTGLATLNAGSNMSR